MKTIGNIKVYIDFKMLHIKVRLIFFRHVGMDVTFLRMKAKGVYALVRSNAEFLSM